MDNNKVCPQCNSEQIEEGVIRAANAVVHMFPANKIKSKTSPISSMYCSNCGFILNMYVDKPQNLNE